MIGGDDQGAYAVADPRAGTSFHGKGKYRVNSFDEPANAVHRRELRPGTEASLSRIPDSP